MPPGSRPGALAFGSRATPRRPDKRHRTAAVESACSGLCHDRPVNPTVTQRPPRPAKQGKSAKQRLDELLVERGLAETRTKAQALILAGRYGSGRATPRARPQAGRSGRATVAVTLAEPRAVRRPGRLQACRRPRRVRDRSGGQGRRSTWAPPPAASPTCCCSAARAMSTLSTWVAGSSPDRCEATRVSPRWSGRTPGR